MEWFASLQAWERSRLLTFEDSAWCQLAANMAARLDRRTFAGQDVRFKVQAPACSGSRYATLERTVFYCVGGGGRGHSRPCGLFAVRSLG